MSKMSRDEADELSLLTRFRELSSQGKADVWAIIQLWHSRDASKDDARRDLRSSSSKLFLSGRDLTNRLTSGLPELQGHTSYSTETFISRFEIINSNNAESRL